MPLRRKPDFDKTKERFNAWWNNELLDRCCIQIYAPKDNAEPFPPYLEQFHRILQGIVSRYPKQTGILRETDREELLRGFELLKKHNEWFQDNTYYGGDAFPTWQTTIYPYTNTMAAFLGCPAEIRQDTGWVHPIFSKGELTDYDYHTVRLQKDNIWYQVDEQLHQYSAQHLGEELVRKVWLGASSGDTLAALRGTENLLMDLMDCPDYVREFDQHLVEESLKLYDQRFDEVYQDRIHGITDWFALWCESKYNTIQNDFAYMISTDLFNEVFLPNIEMQTNFYERCFYHCDGVGNFKHIDALCSLPRLGGIQVLPGEGKPSPLHYMKELKKVQAAGKGLHIHIRPAEVETALKELSAKGLFICTSCGSEEEAETLLKNVEKWSKVR
ncbi:MAG: hypothetical protein IJY82_05275 [Oscillospiraceae bacterium]|nr:hypothetical protein [Oscillospiraceae bacterium]